MTSHYWHEIVELRLREALVPDSNGSDHLAVLTDGLAMIEGQVLLVDPPHPRGVDHNLTAVPLTAVLNLTYKEPAVARDEFWARFGE